MSVYRFIEAEKEKYSVLLLTRVLGVSRSGYYAWRAKAPSSRYAADARLTEKIRCIHTRSRSTYGYPRGYAELRGEWVVGRNRVARLMRAEGLPGCHPERSRFTTLRDPDATPAADLVERSFLADASNWLWLAGIAYVPTLESWLYLASALDAYSRKVAGWHIR